ncbi:MAG TPA: aldo/keto reductase [Kofleriaceae bacterium]|nr:aldo/keto reductase [Kofleriaceae bacterium]
MADHARALGELAASSVGVGTYLGPITDAADHSYEAAIARALELGVNVVDAAISYRHQRSERAIGRALAAAVDRGFSRDEVIVATKGGFIPHGLTPPADVDVVAGIHSIAPAWLDDQIARSRANLGVATIDVYYLHNPETQLEEVAPAVFMARMRDAFATLEQACDDGRIARYGTATWNGYRTSPGTEGHLDLFALESLAREVGGSSHRFRVIQLPLNRRMSEAAEVATQERSGRRYSLLEAASELGIYVMSSASILQGKLAPDASAARDAIDWVRTRPGLGTALVGMGRPAHVDIDCSAFRRS